MLIQEHRNTPDLLYSAWSPPPRVLYIEPVTFPLSFIPHPLKEFENVLGTVLCFSSESQRLQILRSG